MAFFVEPEVLDVVMAEAEDISINPASAARRACKRVRSSSRW